MSRIPSEIIDKVVQLSDILAVARRHVEMTRSGVEWKGLCPFHSERSPSFSVHPEKRQFYCFGCGEGGGVLKLHMRLTGMGFRDAVKDLGRMVGVEVPEEDEGPVEKLDGRPKRTVLLEIMKAAAEVYRDRLWSPAGREALAYLVERRGLSNSVIKDFGLGLAPDNWDFLLKELTGRRLSTKSLEAAGLIKPRSTGGGHYDVFRHRLMIPIADAEGRVVAMSGRVWAEGSDPDSPKYVNSPATDIFAKGRVLYGLHQARPHIRAGGLVFLVEGYFDLISLVSNGVKPVAAVMGTALTPFHLAAIRSLAKEVHLVFDSDRAGQEAAKRALPLLYNAEMDGRVITLPEGHDPDSLVRERGPEAFFELADQAVDIADYFVSRLTTGARSTLTGEGRLVSEAREILGQVPDAAKAQYLRVKLAERLGLSPELLAPSGTPRPAPAPVSERSESQKPARDPLAERLLRHVIAHPAAAPILTGELGAGWTDETTRPLVEAIREALAKTGTLVPENLRLDHDDASSTLLAGAIMNPDPLTGGDPLGLAEAMASKILRNRHHGRELSVTRAIAEAQAEGREDEVARLIATKGAWPHPGGQG